MFAHPTNIACTRRVTLGAIFALSAMACSPNPPPSLPQPGKGVDVGTWNPIELIEMASDENGNPRKRVAAIERMGKFVREENFRLDEEAQKSVQKIRAGARIETMLQQQRREMILAQITDLLQMKMTYEEVAADMNKRKLHIAKDDKWTADSVKSHVDHAAKTNEAAMRQRDAEEKSAKLLERTKKTLQDLSVKDADPYVQEAAKRALSR